MKKIITLLSLIVCTTVFAQAPQKMTYQAVVRDAGGVLVSNPLSSMLTLLSG